MIAKSPTDTRATLPISRKDLLIKKLKSKGRYRYKRYNGLPLRYAGGKSLAVGHILEQLPSEVNFLVSPFVGGGSVEVACANELNLKVDAYDVFDILANYWKVQLASPVKLADTIAQWKPDKATYKLVKERLKKHWDGVEPITDKVDLAAHYWFNHNLSYGPGFLGWMSKIYDDPVRFERLLNKVRNFACKNLKVSHGSFERVIPKHKRDFLYCDPPYYLDGDSRMFRGIYPQRNFPVHHKEFNHKLLRDLLYEHEGGFILSYNDCEVIRDWYSKFRILEVRWQYTLGQGETRIGKNRIDSGMNHHVKQSHELIIVKEQCAK